MSATSTTVAAVQPALALGQVETNLRRVEDLVRDAHREHNPAVIVVPEAASSPNVYSRSMRGVARPVDGAPWHGTTKYQAMRALRRHPWQSWPGGDLPDEIAADGPGATPQATT